MNNKNSDNAKINKDILMKNLKENDTTISQITKKLEKNIKFKYYTDENSIRKKKPLTDESELKKLYEVRNIKSFLMTDLKRQEKYQKLNDTKKIELLNLRIQNSLDMLNKHNTRKYGKLEKLAYNIIFNSMAWYQIIVLDEDIKQFTEKAAHEGNIIEIKHMHNFVSTLANTCDNNINLVSEILIYLLQDSISQVKQDTQQLISIEKLEKTIKNLSEEDKNNIKQLSLELIDYLLSPQIRVQRRAMLFRTKEIEHSYIYQNYKEIRKQLQKQ